MTDDLVELLRDGWTEDGVSIEFDEDVLLVAADCIVELKRAVLDLAQYVSSADLGFYIEPETRKVLKEIGEKKDD
jgi:ethanolamine ammonia-lyase small subunit